MTEKVAYPTAGAPVEIENGRLRIPDCPQIPFIEGDGIGADIAPPMRRVVDGAVERAYGGRRKIVWFEIFAGEKAARLYDGEYLPDETLAALLRFAVSIKGPLATPSGGGMRSLNVAIRQRLDLFACVRPVRYFAGVDSPLKNPEKMDVTVFRENTEDIYAGIEWEAQSEGARRVIAFLRDEMGVTEIRFPDTSAIGIKPISREGSRRLIGKAVDYALSHGRKSVTLVHKGNIMKFTEGGFMRWGYELAAERGAKPLAGGPWMTMPRPDGGELVIKDCIADNFLQQILINPTDFDVVATTNLNGDYASDALAAQVGGIGISPGANMSDSAAVFEATHARRRSMRAKTG